MVMNSSWPRVGEGTPFSPRGPLEKGAPSTLNGEAGLRGGGFWSPSPPSPALCPLQVALDRPHSHLGRDPLSSLAGAPSHLDLITSSLASPRAQGPREGMECEVAWQAGVGALLPALLPRPAPMGWGCPRQAPQPTV